MDPPGTAFPWCALAGATKTQAWTRDAQCYLAKPGVDTNQPWKPDNFYPLDKAACQAYMDSSTHTVPAYQKDSYTPVTYTPVKTDGNFWPNVAYNPANVDQCASVLSIDKWK